ncbi:terminase small subunit [Streptobacillus felis]|uniref:Terminase small subunit n=1 Tax=Streptobacillus felis TaxID=1384509 RepID=A0A7Z0PFT6_9FUSO|nr:terminase small subunit [Streptobacillus felis]
MEQQTQNNILSANEVLSLLSDIAKGEAKEEVIITVGVGDGVSEVKRVEKRVSEKERIRALELLGKRHMLFTDKVENNSNVEIIFSGDENLED